MPHQITTRQLQIPVLETFNNGQSPLIMSRKTQMRNLNQNRVCSNHPTTTPIFWMLHHFYLQNQAKLVLQFSINHQCQASKLIAQFNQERIWMEIRHQTWSLATVASTSKHSRSLEWQEPTILMEQEELPIQISNLISRCLLRKWACKGNIYSALPVKYKHSDHLTAWKVALDQNKLEAISRASCNSAINRHHRMMMKTKRKASSIRMSWRVPNQLNSFVRIWAISKWSWHTTIKLHNSSILVKGCHQLRCSHHRTCPTQPEAKVPRSHMHTKTNHRYSSLTKLQDTHRIPIISTLYTHTKTPTRMAKAAQATVTATNRPPNQLEKHQEQPPPSLQQEATPLHTLALCLVITHTSHPMHLIRKHSLCRASTEAANSC